MLGLERVPLSISKEKPPAGAETLIPMFRIYCSPAVYVLGYPDNWASIAVVLWQLQPVDVLNFPVGWPSMAGADMTISNNTVNASVLKRPMAMLCSICISYFGFYLQ